MEKQSEPAAVALDSQANEQMADPDEQEARARMRDVAARIAERNRDEDPDEVLATVTEVVEEVRRERYERERAGA